MASCRFIEQPALQSYRLRELAMPAAEVEPLTRGHLMPIGWSSVGYGITASWLFYGNNSPRGRGVGDVLVWVPAVVVRAVRVRLVWGAIRSPLICPAGIERFVPTVIRAGAVDSDSIAQTRVS